MDEVTASTETFIKALRNGHVRGDKECARTSAPSTLEINGEHASMLGAMTDDVMAPAN